MRHVLALGGTPAPGQIPSWVQDYTLYLLDTRGRVAWYTGAGRIYGYRAEEALEQQVSFLYPVENALRASLQEELRRAAIQDHFATEGWQKRKDGTRFWANTITVPLKDNGRLQGFAQVVRDFSERHERDEQLRKDRADIPALRLQPTVVGVVSGEFDQISEASDSFLELLGYSQEDVQTGELSWTDLTPPDFHDLDEFAHEEGLRFGSCTPFEKELLRKDGTRVPVLISTAVLKLTPFRWITFVTDLRERDRLESLEAEIPPATHEFEEILGTSAPLKRVLANVELVAPTDATVLILGETGTGKELIARAVHRLSPRRKLPFITLNCAAIPTGLLESELFGYERGAFTGALSQKIGRFEMAHRGTLFLDEVGDIPLELQPKLLRALQEKAFERLGGTRTIPIDVRLIAATNRNLSQMMGDKLFRSDLYYRLKVFPVNSPSLRDHAEDIPLLVRHFTKLYAAKMERKIEKIPERTMDALVAWPWPGNVRELENFIERSVILSPGTVLRAPISELEEESTEAPASGHILLEDVEREHILRTFREMHSVVSDTARRLGIPRTTLRALMKKLKISRSDS